MVWTRVPRLTTEVRGSPATERAPSAARSERATWSRLFSTALRGCGLGGACLRLVQGDAQDHWLPVHLHVLAHSPARRLYERLGFVVTGADDLRLAMTWTPEPDAPARATPPSLEVRHEQA